eukprot:14349516-Ditylum_brightwellii.AAC.1
MAMQTYANNSKIDSPVLLYHLLRQYTGTAESVIRTHQLNLNNLTKNSRCFNTISTSSATTLLIPSRLCVMQEAMTLNHPSSYMRP